MDNCCGEGESSFYKHVVISRFPMLWWSDTHVYMGGFNNGLSKTKDNVGKGCFEVYRVVRGELGIDTALYHCIPV